MYLAQLGVWMVATVIIKICLIVCQIFAEKLLNKFANLILNPFNFDGRIKLLMVMVILPFFLDAFYFWMVDNILKLHPENEPKIIKKKQYIEMPQSLDTDDVSKVGKDENKLEPQKVEIQDSSMIKNEVKLDDSSISK